MSADGYVICPGCQASYRGKLSELKSAYGKVSADEYEQLQKEASAFRQIAGSTELRECYLASVAGDSLIVDYRGDCERCGLALQFNTRVPISEIIR